MTAYDWALTALSYLGIGNALTCRWLLGAFGRRRARPQTAVDYALLTMVVLAWPFALGHRLTGSTPNDSSR
jgi:hypothetical protein